MIEYKHNRPQSGPWACDAPGRPSPKPKEGWLNTCSACGESIYAVPSNRRPDFQISPMQVMINPLADRPSDEELTALAVRILAAEWGSSEDDTFGEVLAAKIEPNGAGRYTVHLVTRL